MYSKQFWIDAIERAIRTFAQAVLAVISVNGTTLLNADWKGIGAAGVLAALVSILMSIVASGTGSDKSASFLNKE